MQKATAHLTHWPAQIRRFRRLSGLRQAALADTLGVDQATVSRWETGRMTPEIGMQRRLVQLMRAAAADEVLLRHATQAAMSQVVLSDGEHVIHAASASYCAAHGVSQSDIVGMSGRPMYGEEAERLRQFAHQRGFYQGDIASLRMVALAHTLSGARRNIRVKVVWTPMRLIDGTILLRSERRELSESEYASARQENGGPLRVVALDDLFA